MADAETSAVLRQRRIVLIHEDAFIAQYLADVIAQSGGVVTRPIGPDVGAALAGGAALVLSDTAPHRDDLVRTATAQRLPLVIVQSAQRSATLATTDRVLTAPFAGLQVVEMLRDLLDQGGAERPIIAASSAHER